MGTTLFLNLLKKIAFRCPLYISLIKNIYRTFVFMYVFFSFSLSVADHISSLDFGLLFPPFFTPFLTNDVSEWPNLLFALQHSPWINRVSYRRFWRIVQNYLDRLITELVKNSNHAKSPLVFQHVRRIKCPLLRWIPPSACHERPEQ